MLDDNSIDALIQPIINYYSLLEQELIVSVAEKFADYDTVSGALEWQIKKLSELGAVNKDLVRIIQKYSGKTQSEIKNMLSAVGYANLDSTSVNDAFENGLSRCTFDSLMQSESIANTILYSAQALLDTYSLINTRALQAARQTYVDIINRSYLDVASGTYSLQESVIKGVRRMARNGITAATYIRPNGRVVNYSIEGVVRRDTITAVHQLCNRVALQSAEEMGSEYVRVSAHIGARTHPTDPIANHYGWQGKVYKLHGSEPLYPNLGASTGYPDDILGLGGVNCRHRMFPFFPGISVNNEPQIDDEKNKRVYEARQKQRQLERRIRSLKKERAAAKAIGDKDGVNIANMKLKNAYNEINDHCERNGLRRDFSRELVSEQITKPVDYINLKNGNESGTIKSASGSPYGNKVDYNPDAEYKIVLSNKPDAVNEGLSSACKQVAELGFSDGNEHLALVDLISGKIEYTEIGLPSEVGGTNFWNFIKKNKNRSYAFVHNHNTNTQYSETDLRTLLGDNPINMFVISRCDGKCFVLETNGKTPENLIFDFIYKDDIDKINDMLRKGEIEIADRSGLREKCIVDNLIRDFTEGVIEFG